MTTFTIYNLETGIIDRVFSGDEAALQLNVKDGEGYVSGYYENNSFTIVSGVPIERPNPISNIPSPSSLARMQRDMLLQQSDWTQVPDAPVDQASWATYRQALRDITEQAGFPDNIVWPIKPD